MKNTRVNRPGQNANQQTTILSRITSKSKVFRTSFRSFIEKRPVVSFFSFLGLLLVVIVIGSILRNPAAKKEQKEQPAKAVSVFGIGVSPKVALTGKIEKSGVVHVLAQMPGVVQNIYVHEGDKVGRGSWIVGLSSTYGGANIPSISRQMAQKSYDTTIANFDTQMTMIQKRKDLANTQANQASDLRNIANDSISDIQNLISLNQDILGNIQSNLDFLTQNSTDSATILQVKQGKALVEQGLLSLQSQLRTVQYQAAGDTNQANLVQISKDLALSQIDIDERMIKLSKETAALNLAIAQATEAQMFPATPIAGVVERVTVQVGQFVSPGTPIAIVTGNKNTANMIVRVSREMAQSLSRLEPSTIVLGGKSYNVLPRYISTEPTDGSLYTILYTLPDEAGQLLGDGETVRIDVPVGKVGGSTTAAVPYIPIDAIYQTQDASYVFVASQSAQGKFVAQNRTITLGDVMGSYVRVISGITANDQVIISRSVVDGDPITIQ